MDNYYLTTQQLYQYITSLNNKVVTLEKTVQSLQSELSELRDKPSINVEKLEYKFDQLKVETLSGTLNIGLNPSDISDIEDFSVPQNEKLSQKQLIPYRGDILKSLQEYIKNEVPLIIEDNEMQLERSIDRSYFTAIQEDISKQLPSRVDFYMKTIPIRSEKNEQDILNWQEKIITKVKKDIQNSIFTFMTQLPNEMKGTIDNESSSS